MNIKHESWGIIISLANGGEIEIHKNDDGELSEVTINGKSNSGEEVVSRDISFSEDGKIFADGMEI